VTVSQPSREIYAIDVPEPTDFVAAYRYNFFVPDESVNETGGVPASFLAKPAGEVDARVLQYSITRVPRMVQLTWSKSLLADVAGQVDELSQRSNASRSVVGQDGSLILRNVSSVVTEEQFASRNYVAVHFSDNSLDRKLSDAVSGSTLAQGAVGGDRYHAARATSVGTGVIAQAASDPGASYGATFYRDAGAGSNRSGTGGLLVKDASVPIERELWARLRRVGVNVQVNARLLPGMLDVAIRDPASTNAADMAGIQGYARAAKHAVDRSSAAATEDDYRPIVPFVSLRENDAALHQQKYGAQLVGYVIDKAELRPDGSVVAHPPIVVDNPHSTSTADFRVRFNARYRYSARAVVMLTVPGIDDVTGDVALIQVLVSSRSSPPVVVSTLQLDNPPPPGDLKFVWDYGEEKLLVTWAFPVTSQRSIKRFQVLSRARVSDAFELRKVYDFDDSLVPFPQSEAPDPSLVERGSSTSWVDDEFDAAVSNGRGKGVIYATCAVDAHGLTSNYSAQYRVWFDRFKNQLQVELVSHSGAPKPYPNLYLEGDLFQSTIRVSGGRARRMRLYFNPDYYYTYDDHGSYSPALATLQAGGGYQLQFMNLDNAGTQVINVSIDDRTTPQAPASPQFNFGPKR